MPEQKPYPVEKQACHDDEKKVCEQKEITEPKQVKKYVYKKECKKVPREICSTAVYKSLEVNNVTLWLCFFSKGFKELLPLLLKVHVVVQNPAIFVVPLTIIVMANSQILGDFSMGIMYRCM